MDTNDNPPGPALFARNPNPDAGSFPKNEPTNSAPNRPLDNSRTCPRTEDT
jgi:hypothetical protein